MTKPNELRKIVSIVDPYSDDRFVGLRMGAAGPQVIFPLGYSVPDCNSELQADMRRLLQVIASCNHLYSEFSEYDDPNSVSRDASIFRAYTVLIEDYIRTGILLSEREFIHSASPEGKIDWPRTIALKSPVISNDGVFYIDLVSRRASTNRNSKIRLAHEAALSMSFEKVGWLYPYRSHDIPKKVRVDAELVAAVRKRLYETFQDQEVRLLNAVLSVLTNSSQGNNSELQVCGTNSFEHVWEYMVDQAFGTVGNERSDYFPRVTWSFGNSSYSPSPLVPDTIMILDQKTCILDAKYYRFGVTSKKQHLPGSSDVAKQVVYGEHAFRKLDDSDLDSLYNAFVLPGSFMDSRGIWCKAVGISSVSWLSNPEPHQIVAGILVDTKFLLRHYKAAGQGIKRNLMNAIVGILDSVGAPIVANTSGNSATTDSPKR